MNVMAKAHKKTRKVVNEIEAVRGYRAGRYAKAFSVYLKQAHMEHKEMTQYDLDALWSSGERVNTHDLKDGDVILHHWCLMKVKNRRVYTYASDLLHDEKGTVQFDSDCLYRSERSGIPKHWIDCENGWTVQGNSKAQWTRVKI